MPAITIPDLNNAKLDVDHIAAFANSAEPTVTDRMGNVKPSISGLSAEYPNASVNATSAAADALASEASRQASGVSAGLAATAKTQAETARDAANVNGKIYATTAAGLTAVASGGYFSVPSTDSAEYLILYLNNAGAAVEQKRYQSRRGSDLAKNAALTAVDELSDFQNGFFVDTWGYTKSFVAPATPLEILVASRDSATQFTLAAGGGASFSGTGSAVVVKDTATGRHASHGVQSLVGDVVTVYGALPAAITSAQSVHDGNNGQHLSRLGFKGLADFVVDQVQKYSYKKSSTGSLLFYYHPPITERLVWSDSNIYNIAKTIILISPVKLGTAGNGGYVAGTSNLSRNCGVEGSAVAAKDLGSYMASSYNVTDSVAGNGIEISLNVNQVSGFIQIPVTANAVTYDTTLKTTGRVRLQVLGDGTPLLDATYDIGAIQFASVDFSGVDQIKVRMTLADSVPSSIALLGIYAWQKSAATPKTGYFQSGDVVAFLGDSWTQYPSATGGEVLPLRPDGSTGEGMQFLSVRMKERLAADGITVTTLNMGKGGQTSAWGRYWVDKIIGLTPRPTHCVINFWINDYNSSGNGATTTDTVYDFDPANMWVNKVQSLGGKKGSVTFVQWYENLQYISRRLLAAGIKPIVLMPGHTASISQCQSIQQNLLAKIVPGFNDINKAGGGS